MIRAPLLVPFWAVIVALAACSQTTPPPAPETPAITDTPPVIAPLTGAFSATSTTAVGITGDLTLTDTRLSFGKGFMLNTAPAAGIDMTALTHKGGESFAQTMSVPTNFALELRGVAGVVKAAGARVQPLCGPDTPTFVALAYDTPVTAVPMAVFSGPDAPGPAAAHSSLCGTFLYNK